MFRFLTISLLFAAFLTPFACAGDFPPVTLRDATPEELVGHDKVRSSDLGPTVDAANRLVPHRWRAEDDVVEGWDWSLPPDVKAVDRSGMIVHRNERRTFPAPKLINFSFSWKDVEPEEGRYDFSRVLAQLKNPPEGVDGYRVHFFTAVADDHDLRSGRHRRAAPEWLDRYDIPKVVMPQMEGRFQLTQYAIWHGEYHKRYLRVLKALGESGIPQIDTARIIYIGGISKSRGEEMHIPRETFQWCREHAGLTPELLERSLTGRLDAWARAFRGVEHKLAWVGAGGDIGGDPDFHGLGVRVLRHAYSIGMGQRCGFVENYLYQLQNPDLGQSVDPRGYLIVDESCPAIAKSLAFGDENEEYGPYWTGRFGPLQTHAYRHHESMLRTLQMRRNYLWISDDTIDMDPPLTTYVALSLGRTIADTPDAWCYLRESRVRGGAAGRPREKIVSINNFERWLVQRDVPGYRTVPVIRAAQHKLWMVPDGERFDHIARRTDLASGNGRIGFALDDRFFGDAAGATVKITYHDIGTGRWSLFYSDTQGEPRRKTID